LKNFKARKAAQEELAMAKRECLALVEGKATKQQLEIARSKTAVATDKVLALTAV
jgi:hypothetical protein